MYRLNHQVLDHPTDESLKALLTDDERMRFPKWAMSASLAALAIRWVEVTIWRRKV